MEGDYALAQNAIMEIVKALLEQPINVFVLFHIDSTDPAKGPQAIGPATVGQKAIRRVAGAFANLIRMQADSIPVPGTPPTTKIVHNLYTRGQGSYLGGIRTPHGENPFPKIAVPPDDPASVWRKLMAAHRGQPIVEAK
jgi:hypothetical protein